MARKSFDCGSPAFYLPLGGLSSTPSFFFHPLHTYGQFVTGQVEPCCVLHSTVPAVSFPALFSSRSVDIYFRHRHPSTFLPPMVEARFSLLTGFVRPLLFPRDVESSPPQLVSGFLTWTGRSSHDADGTSSQPNWDPSLDLIRDASFATHALRIRAPSRTLRSPHAPIF